MRLCSCCKKQFSQHSDTEKFDCLLTMSDFLDWLKTSYRFFNSDVNLIKIWEEQISHDKNKKKD